MSDKREVTSGVLITISNEFTVSGSIANDNAFYIAQTLRSHGLKVRTQMVTVSGSCGTGDHN